jgi:hypothetical protein
VDVFEVHLELVEGSEQFPGNLVDIHDTRVHLHTDELIANMSQWRDPQPRLTSAPPLAVVSDENGTRRQS